MRLQNEMLWGVWYTAGKVLSRPSHGVLRAPKYLKCHLVSQEKQIYSCLSTAEHGGQKNCNENMTAVLFRQFFSTSDGWYFYEARKIYNISWVQPFGTIIADSTPSLIVSNTFCWIFFIFDFNLQENRNGNNHWRMKACINDYHNISSICGHSQPNIDDFIHILWFLAISSFKDDEIYNCYLWNLQSLEWGSHV